MRTRSLAAAAEYEADLKVGIVSVRETEVGVRHSQDYVSCAKGPRCAWPVHCCQECNRHSRIKHDCGGT